jgi:hypothetical protein
VSHCVAAAPADHRAVNGEGEGPGDHEAAEEREPKTSVG